MSGYRYPDRVRLSSNARNDLARRLATLRAKRAKLDGAFGTMPESERNAAIQVLDDALELADSVFQNESVWLGQFDQPQAIKSGHLRRSRIGTLSITGSS